MMTDADFAEIVASLTGGDLKMRVAALRVFEMTAASDPRLLPYLEALLDDHAPCVISRPYTFGEVRWLAAHAVAKERAAEGIAQPVRLSGVPIPLSTDDLSRLERAAGLPRQHQRGVSGIEGMLALFAELRELGQLPLADLALGESVPASSRYILLPPRALREALADDAASVSEILGEPSLDRSIVPSYELVIHTLKYAREELAEGGISLAPPDERWVTEIILMTGERVPVTIIGSATLTPDFDAMEPGESPLDRGVLMIREADLTPTLARQARWLIRRRAERDGPSR